MLVIHLNVGVTNPIIFFLLDIPAVWAIQRGLLALQPYYLYRKARVGRTVLFARSRILNGVTGWPSIFVLINIAELVCLCFATLGVGTEKEMRWERASFKNVTTLAMPSSRDSARFRFTDTTRENKTCRTRNATHAEYWPVAFNAEQRWGPDYAVDWEPEDEQEFGLTNFWHGENASCQANAPGATPIFTASCVSFDNHEPFSLDAMSSVQQVHFQFDNASEARESRFGRSAPLPRVEWNAILTSVAEDGDIHPLVGTRVHLFKYHQLTQSYCLIESCLEFQERRSRFALLLINHSPTSSWFFSLGFDGESSTFDPSSREISRIFFVTTPLRLALHESSSVDYILHGLGSNDFSEMQQMKNSSFLVFEDVFLWIYRGVPLPPTRSVYIRKPDADVTTVDLRATILYGIIIVLAIVLLPMKEVLDFVLVRHGQLNKDDLLVYDYDYDRLI